VILTLLAAADLLLVNGRVHTFDPAHPEAEALLVRGERIVAVGSASALRAQAAPDARVLDLGGRAVIPGLIDTHTHLFAAMASRVAGDLDVGIPAVRSLAEAVEAVRRRAADTPPGAWIVGDGWGESKWPERRYIRKADLDPVSAGRPVYLEHVSGHAATLNSEGLRLSGITRDTPDPQGGFIERAPSGEPTGVLKDTAMDLAKIERKRPGPDDRLATAERAGREAGGGRASPPSTTRSCPWPTRRPTARPTPRAGSRSASSPFPSSPTRGPRTRSRRSRPRARRRGRAPAGSPGER
jgi:predicted amidohydrolase YtcJ